jgi:hypothetical protein
MMNENERHNIDETFRNKIEQMSLNAPSPNLDGVRANILQRNLQSSQFQNRWLKGSLAAMTLLLGSCVYFLINKPDEIDKTLTHEKIINVYQTDTVFITKFQTKIIKVPVLIYPKATQNRTQYTNIIQPNSVLNEKTFTNDLPNENLSVSNEYNKVSHTPKYLSLSKVKDNQLFDNQEIGNNSNPLITKNKMDKSIFTRSESGRIMTENITNNPNNVVDNNIENQPIKLLSYDYLNSKPYHSDIAWETPLLKYRSPVKPTIKPQKITIPFMDRLTLGVFFSPENNVEDIRNDNIQAFGLGDENIINSSSLGARIGFKVTKKISVITGVELQTMNFVHVGMGKEPIIAIGGAEEKPIFLRYTVFGVAQIPTVQMTTNPKVGSEITVEGEMGHFIQALKIPVSLKYQFYERTLNGFGWRGAGLNIYAIGGGYFAIPTQQHVKIEIYEPNGNDFYTTLTNFNNTNPYTGFNLGFGTEFSYGNHIQFYVEPYYQNTIKSLVNNMPIRTYVNGIGVKFGVNYQFVKK